MRAPLKILAPPGVLANRRRVAVVDDHAFMRDLIARELSRRHEDYDVVATVATAADAISICRDLTPNLLVLDINLPDRTGVAAVPDIRRASPHTRILLCTAHPKDEWLGEASSCGADGFVEKTNTWDDFLLAVDRVSQGQRYFCSGAARRRDVHASTNVRL